MYRSSTDTLERWFNPDWISLDHIPTTPVDLPLLQVGGSGWGGEGRSGGAGGRATGSLAAGSQPRLTCGTRPPPWRSKPSSTRW